MYMVLTCFAYAFPHILIVIHPEPHQRPQHPVQSSSAECFPSAILIFRNPTGSASYLKPVWMEKLWWPWSVKYSMRWINILLEELCSFPAGWVGPLALGQINYNMSDVGDDKVYHTTLTNISKLVSYFGTNQWYKGIFVIPKGQLVLEPLARWLGPQYKRWWRIDGRM